MENEFLRSQHSSHDEFIRDEIKHTINRIREKLPTRKPGPITYIGLPINFNNLRNHIIDNQLTEDSIILLNPKNFDDIIIEYRNRYNKSMPIPFKYLGVMLEEDLERTVPIGRICTIEI